jgi:hypothetical protein
MRQFIVDCEYKGGEYKGGEYKGGEYKGGEYKGGEYKGGESAKLLKHHNLAILLFMIRLCVPLFHMVGM